GRGRATRGAPRLRYRPDARRRKIRKAGGKSLLRTLRESPSSRRGRARSNRRVDTPAPREARPGARLGPRFQEAFAQAAAVPGTPTPDKRAEGTPRSDATRRPTPEPPPRGTANRRRAVRCTPDVRPIGRWRARPRRPRGAGCASGAATRLRRRGSAAPEATRRAGAWRAPAVATRCHDVTYLAKAPPAAPRRARARLPARRWRSRGPPRFPRG